MLDYIHTLYTLADFTAEEIARKSEIYVLVRDGRNICKVCGDLQDAPLTDMTPKQQRRHSRYAPLPGVFNLDRTAPLQTMTRITLKGIDAETGDEVTETFELNGTEPVTSKHCYASGLPRFAQVLGDDPSRGEITVDMWTPPPELIVAFFINGKYVIYDDADPRGVDADVCDGIVTRHNGRHPVLVTALDFHSAERLMDKAVIEWSDELQRWTVY